MYRLCTIFGSCHRVGIHGRIELRPITIGDYMRVYAGSEYFAEADRIYWFWNARDIHIEPCSHSGNPCTWCKYGK